MEKEPVVIQYEESQWRRSFYTPLNLGCWVVGEIPQRDQVVIMPDQGQTMAVAKVDLAW